MKLRLIAIGTAFLTSAPAMSLPTSKLELLGVKVGDSIASVAPKLAAKGFRIGTDFNNTCTTTYDRLMSKLVVERVAKVDKYSIGCKQAFYKPGSSISVTYFITPSGYKVDGVSYAFESPDPTNSVLRDLTAKYGPPDVTEYNSTEWRVDRNSRYGAKAYYLRRADTLHHIEVYGNTAEVFVAEVNKDLAKRLGPVTRDF